MQKIESEFHRREVLEKGNIRIKLTFTSRYFISKTTRPGCQSISTFKFMSSVYQRGKLNRTPAIKIFVEKREGRQVPTGEN